MRNLRKLLFCLAVFALLSFAYAASASAEGNIKGTITCDNVNLRANPGTSSDIITRLSEGNSVLILGSNDNWYKVRIGDKVGWVCGDYIEITAYVSVDILNLRSKPNTSSDIVTKLSANTKVVILESANDWYMVRISNGKTGWVLGKYISTKIDTISRGSDTDISVEAPDSDNGTAQEIIAYAKRFLGVGYVYGASGPGGFDCSGFTKYVFGHFGINLERTACDQSSQGEWVSYSNLRAGDLVFFDTKQGRHSHVNHAGIYIGDGMFIQASSEKGRVVISELVDGFYENAYMTARRIL